MEHITKDSINFLHFAFNKTKSPSFSQINKQRHIIKFKTPLINLEDKLIHHTVIYLTPTLIYIRF